MQLLIWILFKMILENILTCLELCIKAYTYRELDPPLIVFNSIFRSLILVRNGFLHSLNKNSHQPNHPISPKKCDKKIFLVIWKSIIRCPNFLLPPIFAFIYIIISIIFNTSDFNTHRYPKIKSLRGFCIGNDLKSTRITTLKSYARCIEYFRMKNKKLKYTNQEQKIHTLYLLVTILNWSTRFVFWIGTWFRNCNIYVFVSSLTYSYTNLIWIYVLHITYT